MVKLYKIRYDVSEDGRGHFRDVVCTADLSVAKQIAKKVEPYGFENQYTTIDEIVMVSSFAEFEKYENDRIIAGAMSKLNSKEKELLHLA